MKSNSLYDGEQSLIGPRGGRFPESQPASSPSRGLPPDDHSRSRLASRAPITFERLSPYPLGPLLKRSKFAQAVIDVLAFVFGFLLALVGIGSVPLVIFILFFVLRT